MRRVSADEDFDPNTEDELPNPRSPSPMKYFLVYAISKYDPLTLREFETTYSLLDFVNQQPRDGDFVARVIYGRELQLAPMIVRSNKSPKEWGGSQPLKSRPIYKPKAGGLPRASRSPIACIHASATPPAAQLLPLQPPI